MDVNNTRYRIIAVLVIFAYIFITPFGNGNIPTARASTTDQSVIAPLAIASGSNILELPEAIPPAPPSLEGSSDPDPAFDLLMQDSRNTAGELPPSLIDQWNLQQEIESANRPVNNAYFNPVEEILPSPLNPIQPYGNLPGGEQIELKSPRDSEFSLDPASFPGEILPSPETGTFLVRGSLKDAVDSPLVGAVIRANSVDRAFFMDTLTDAYGNFWFTQLPVGEYLLTARTQDGMLSLRSSEAIKIDSREAGSPEFHALTLKPEVLQPPQSTQYVPTPSQAVLTAGAEIAPASNLQGTASISGTVTKTGGVPLSNAEVTLYTSEYAWVNQVYTDSAGLYTFSGLDAGDYILYFFCYDTCDPAGLNGEFFNDKQTFETADLVTVADSATVINIDAMLQQYGSISGTVSSEIDLNPMEGVYVSIENTARTYSNGTNTDADGNYTFPYLSPDSYILYFNPYNGFGSEYYDSKTTFEEADPVTVTWDQQVTGINALLDPGTSISGVVTSETDGTPISALVTAMMMSSPYDNYFAYTNLDGSYTIPNLPPGGYRLHFRPENECDTDGCTQTPYIAEYYNGKEYYVEGDIVTVADQEHVTNINATLQTGAFLTVEIKAFDGVTPLPGVYIYLIDQYDSTLWLGSTGSTGINNSIAMKPGTYRLRFDTTQCDGLCSEHLSEYYNGAATLEAATPIDLVVDNPLTVSVVLSTGGSVSGNFTTVAGLCSAENYPQASLYYPESTWADRMTVPDSSGNYQFGGLSSGDYKVAFSCNGFLTEWYNDKADLSSADLIPVTAGQETSGISAVLSKAGGISGRVTNSDGLPLVDVYVSASNSGGSFMTYTDADGIYTFESLPDGVFTVYFSPPGGTYLTEYYDNQTTYETATPVQVTAPNITTGINAVLSAGGVITGNLTGETGLCSPFYSSISVFSSESYTQITSVAPDESGNFSTPGLHSGSYKLQFYCQGFVSEWYNNVKSFDEAQPVAVTAGEQTSGINAVLAAAGSIAGTVTSESTGLGIGSVYVSASNSTESYSTWTQTSGEYWLDSIPAGEYKLYFSPSDGIHIGEYYNNKDSSELADPVTVTALTTTENIDAALSTGGEISGTVTSAVGAAPLEGIGVILYKDIDPNWWWYSASKTDAEGKYSFVGLPSGNYRVNFDPGYDCPTGCANDSYIGEYYNDKQSFDTANSIPVTAGQLTANIDGVLEPGGTMSGQVTDEDTGLPLANIQVVVSSGSYYRSQNTNEDGYYSISGIPSGTYRVSFETWNNTAYAQEYYNNKTSYSAADLVTITAPQVLTEIDAALAKSVSLSGKVISDVDSQPLVGVDVHMSLVDGDGWVTSTDSEGNYSFTGRQAGTYYLYFNPTVSADPRTQEHMSEYYKDVRLQEDASLITLVPGQNAVGYNASLGVGAKISGRVTDSATGLPLDLIQVSAYFLQEGNSRRHQASATTDTDGNYTIRGLPAGQYYVYFYPQDESDYVSESYNNKIYWKEGDQITVSELGHITGIDAALEKGRHITGQLTSASTGLPITGWFNIGVYDEDGYWREWAYLDSTGTYLTPALRPGRYTLNFDTTGKDPEIAQFLSEYYNGRPNLTVANFLTVGTESDVIADTVSLDMAGQISGRVTAQATGLGIGGAPVTYRSLEYPNYPWYVQGETVFTAPDGTYTLPYLEPGEYQVCFGSVNELVGECRDGIRVGIGSLISGIDAELPIGGRISGVVTADGSLTPLSDISVEIYAADGEYITSAVTAPLTGAYVSQPVPPGDYILNFYTPSGGPSGNYLDEYYNDQPDRPSAQLVSVNAGLTTEGINASLASGGSISGRITSAQTGLPASDSMVVVYSFDDAPYYQSAGYGYPDIEGNYTVSGLNSGSYKVFFNSDSTNNLLEQWYPNQATPETAELINLTAPENITGIDAALEGGGQISGLVTDLLGNPLTRAQVYAQTDNLDNNFSGWANTDENGFYTMGGLPTDEYRVSFTQYPYAPEVYGGIDTPTYVNVTVGNTTPNINMTMTRGAVIAGWVTAPDTGWNLAASVIAFNASGNEVVSTSANTPRGYYELYLKPGQDYRLMFDTGWYGDRYVYSYYQNKISLETADPISLAAGDVLYPVNGSLRIGGQISGQVTSESDLPLADVMVLAYVDAGEARWASTTDASGNYTIGGFPTGNYRLLFDPTSSLTLAGYLPEYYANRADFTSADPIAVVIGETTSGINAQLTKSVLPIAGFGIGSQTVIESSGSVTVSLTLDKPGAELITIPFTVTGTASGGGIDHNLANGTFQFAVGETQDTININIVDDAIHEADETIVLTLGSPTNAALGSATIHTVTIQDNDELPLVSFASPTQTVSEAVGTVTVTLNLNTTYVETVSVPYSVSGYAAGGGIDHTLQNGVLIFNPGQTSKTITFSVVNDSIDEMDESIVITLGQPVNAQPGAIHLHTVTVQDNDEPVFVLPAPTVTQVTPSQGWSHIPTEIVLYGTNFSSGAVATLKLNLQSSALSTTFISETQLLAVVPGGLPEGLYSLEVSNPDGKKGSLSGAYKVMPQITDDLFANSYDIWTEPGTVYAGKSTSVGLNIQRQGGLTTLPTVKVDFYLGDPAAGGTKLATVSAGNLVPGGWVSTSGFSWTAPAAGTTTLVAVIDPENSVNETNETNNKITRQITVLSEPVPQADLTPPTISSFVVNEGRPNSASPAISYTSSAVDNLGGSGLNKTMIIEYAFFEGINQWAQVKSSDWLPYQENIDQTYQLVETAGARYLQIWAADNAGNVSTEPRTAFINYVPANDTLVKGQSRYYVYNLTKSQEFNAVLTPTQGDPDLYVWAPDFYARDAWMSLASEGPDTVVFSSPLAGMYVVQIYSYTNSGFQFTAGGIPLSRLNALTFTPGLNLSKEPVAEPGLEPGNVPSEQRAIPDAPQGEPVPTTYPVFLPMIKR